MSGGYTRSKVSTDSRTRMKKLNEALRIMQILVESAGGSIEPVRHLLCKNQTDVTSKDDSIRLDELCYTAFNGFFHCCALFITAYKIFALELF